MKLVRKGELTHEQLVAIEYLSLPRNGGYTLEQLAEKLGINPRTLYDWRQDALFAGELRRKTMARAAEHLPDVMDTLTEKAKEGRSIRAVETWLKAMGLLQPEMIVRPALPEEDPRSDAHIQDEIAQLRKELSEIQGDTDNGEE